MNPGLILTAGLPGTGKTVLVNKLMESAKQIGIKHTYCNLTNIRQEMGYKVFRGDQDAPILRKSNRFILDALAENNLVFMDSVNRFAHRRHGLYAIASCYDAPVAIVECICDEKIAKKRLSERPIVKEMIADTRLGSVYEKHKNEWQPIEKDLGFPETKQVSYLQINTNDGYSLYRNEAFDCGKDLIEFIMKTIDI